MWLEEISSGGIGFQPVDVPSALPKHFPQRLNFSLFLKLKQPHQHVHRILGKSGPFWQQETWDHYARNEAETLRIINYIELNPVKAGIVERPEDFQWSSAKIRKAMKIHAGDPIPDRGIV